MQKSQYIVSLTKAERKLISQLCSKGKNPSYSLTNAQILLLADINSELGGWQDAEILQFINTNTAKIQEVKTQFVEAGLYSALRMETPTLDKPQYLNKFQEIEIPGYLETVFCTRKTLTFYEHDKHSFDLILSYPLNQEFLNQTDLKQKIAQFHYHILQPEQYVLKFKVNQVRVGYSAQYYLIGFSGTVSGEYLEVKTTEVINLLTTLLESFFLCAASRQFNPLLFKLDGQIIIQPTFETKGVPQEYNFSIDFEEFIAWSLQYLVSDLVYLLGEIAVGASSEILSDMAISAGESGGELLVGVTEFVGEASAESIGIVAEVAGGMIEVMLTFFAELIAGLFSP